MSTRYCVIPLLSCLCLLFLRTYAYNPMATPPFRGRYPIGYDPLKRGRPTQPLRKDVLRNKRWQPPTGYVPTSQKGRPELRSATAPSSNNSTSAEYIEWDNCCDKEGQISLCSGIWMNKRILYRTCVVFPKSDNTSAI